MCIWMKSFAAKANCAFVVKTTSTQEVRHG